MRAKSICGVILVSDDAARVADFYSRFLGCEFERENHGGLAEHFGVDIGTVHFGIHPPSNFDRTTAGKASTVLAFDVASLREAAKVLEELGAEQVQPPHYEGFGMVASYKDPDGNVFEIVELTHRFETDAPADRRDS